MKKKNKIIIGAISAFTLVSVATIGFSSWVIGVQQQEVDVEGLQLSVDTVENDSVFLDVTLPAEETVKICEPSKVTRTETTDIVGTSDTTSSGGIGFAADAMTFSLDTITLRVGKNVSSANTPKGVKFTLSKEDGKNTFNTVKTNEFASSEDGWEDKTGRTGSSWTYLALETTIALTEFTNDSETNSSASYTTYTLEDKQLTLLWGTFFGNATVSGQNKKPTDFYNSLYKAAEPAPSFDILMEAATKATTELKAMNTKMTNKTITLKAEVVTGVIA
ncbi:MAG: hypothetical protein IAC58_01495 [Firmicutes bacterium]|uniref:Uncharacterized protein n=1 Tax=Candidatus Onthovivens merdipullorum TaxID=2840889 RepID=A0A9D9DGH7_9BACL|nr:hypothetical protein [Candidatus Onthovivens merdipullorum]